MNPDPAVSYAGTPELDAITEVSARDIWAAGVTALGMQPFPLVEHWNGKSWSIASGNGWPNLCCAQSLAGTSPTQVWQVFKCLCGTGLAPDGYWVQIQRWNGSSWRDVTSPNVGSQRILNAVSARSKTNAWAVGGAQGGTPYQDLPIEHWNGSVWKLLPGPKIGT